MNNNEKDYQKELLRKFSENYLNKISEKGKKDDLDVLKKTKDQIVWDISSDFYSQCGHKADFEFVKIVVDSYIQSFAKSIDDVGASKRLDTILKKVYVKPEVSILEVSDCRDLFPGNQKKASIFAQLRNILVENLSVGKDEVDIGKRLNSDLGADNMDSIEVIMAIEEEFDIAIPDTDAEEYLGFYYEVWPSGGSFLGVLSAMSKMSANTSSGVEGASCTVGEIVEYLYDRLPDTE